MHTIHSQYLVLLSLLCFMLPSCAFHALKKEVKELNTTYTLSGSVSNTSQSTGEEIVVIFKKHNGKLELYDNTITEETGHFSILVPAGDYYVGAFNDENYNFTFDPDEYGNFYGAPQKITLPVPNTDISETRSKLDIHITIQNIHAMDPGFSITLDAESLARKSFFKLGIVKELDDPIYSQANGTLGYWKPMSFIRDVGMGIFFLHEYDPDKIPLLFVHGATGTPAGWKTIVENLDHTRFQPWFFYYPSGVRLDTCGRALNIAVERLHEQFHFDKLYLFAHSMGGLVTRSFILQNAADQHNQYISLFTSVSSPWNGHPATASGVKNAPEAVPSWHDMVPDSDFIQSLFNTSMPSPMTYYLFFTIKGNCSLFMANNDGTVEISSQLDPRAQIEADRLFGYNEGHDSILESTAFIRQFNQLLKEQYQKDIF
ncbi:lipase family alpha/beta hydrolase [Desulfogranum japonicum]|uniref:lipase family alpha/beta hydrolase n=1 Tax=Desulfogranum japonicum TaxID=231447 RepID=UPI001376A2B2|nr:alpha/beta hydrolase [Desulfogranum japonicum]